MSQGCCPVHLPPHMFEFYSFIHLGEGPAVPLCPPQADFLSREHPNAEDCKAAHQLPSLLSPTLWSWEGGHGEEVVLTCILLMF